MSRERSEAEFQLLWEPMVLDETEVITAKATKNLKVCTTQFVLLNASALQFSISAPAGSPEIAEIFTLPNFRHF